MGFRMTKKLRFYNFSDEVSGTLFSRCFWYTIISVLTAAGVDVSTTLRLQSPRGDQLHIERNVAANQVCVRYYVAQPDGTLVHDLAVVFAVSNTGRWTPIEFYRAKTGRRVFVMVDAEANRMTLIDPLNQWACAAYCDGWSFHLREQGWLEKGMVV